MHGVQRWEPTAYELNKNRVCRAQTGPIDSLGEQVQLSFPGDSKPGSGGTAAMLTDHEPSSSIVLSDQ